jgi:hypothetical protein
VISYVLPSLPNQDWMVIILSLVYLGGTLWMTLSWVKATTARVDITITDWIVRFSFPKKNIFHRKDLELSFGEIRNLGEDNDKGFDFLYFETPHPEYRKFHITAAVNNPEFEAFRKQMYEMKNEFNKSAPADRIISNRSIYQKWPMKIVALIAVLFIFGYPFVSYTLKTTWLMEVKYWVIVAIGTPFIIKVYNQNYRK